jgi:hypothetical protein
MANEIKTNYQSGGTLYVLLRNSVGKVYSVSDETFVTYDNDDLSDYAIVLTDAGGDLYQTSFPTAITTPGTYYAIAYLRSGASPMDTDALVSGGEIVWDGSAEAAGDGPNLTTLAYVKELLGITVATYDDVLTNRLAAASSAVRAYCGHRFTTTAYVEYHDNDWWSAKLTLRQYPVTSLTAVTIRPYEADAETYDGGDFIVTSYGAISPKPSSDVEGFPAGFQSVKVEYEAGASTVPADVQEATAMIVRSLYQQIGNADKAAYDSERLGDYNYKLKADAFAAISGEAKAILDHHRRWRV